MVEGALCLYPHRARRARAEVDPHDHRVRGSRTEARQRILAAGNVGTVAAGEAPRAVEAQPDSASCAPPRLEDRCEDEDCASRKTREGGARRIRGSTVAVADTPRRPSSRLLGRRNAGHRAIRGVERAIRSRAPAWHRQEPEGLRPGSDRQCGNDLHHLRNGTASAALRRELRPRAPGVVVTRELEKQGVQRPALLGIEWRQELLLDLLGDRA
jgi:hypothetical protein